MRKCICVITSGHLAGTPRMLKAADALYEAGYAVRVVCAEHVDWGIEAGIQLRAKRPWRCDVVHWHPRTGWHTYWKSRLRHKALRLLARSNACRRLSLRLLASAACRVAPELIRAATREPADLIYAGTAGGLTVGAIAAHCLGALYALDLEDFHSGEQGDGPTAQGARSVMEAVEAEVLPRAEFLTAGSPPIADAYAEKYGIRPMPVNNTFALPRVPPPFDGAVGRPLRLFWFSQTIGPGRGLEDAVRAACQLGRRVQLGMLGKKTEFSSSLARMALGTPNLQVDFLPHCAPDEVVNQCRGWDVGLALEKNTPLNRDLCLTNKIFTYPLAGLAIAATDTTAQRQIIPEFGEGAYLYPPGNSTALAAGLKRWADDPAALVRAKRASWEAAKRRWNWEHPLERGALLEAVARVIGKP